MFQTLDISYISIARAAVRYDFTGDHLELLCRRGEIRGALRGGLWYLEEASLKSYLHLSSEVAVAIPIAHASGRLLGVWAAALIVLFVFAGTSLHVLAYSPSEDSFSMSFMAAAQVASELAQAIPARPVLKREPTIRVVYAKDIDQDTESVPVNYMASVVGASRALDEINSRLFSTYARAGTQVAQAAAFDADAVEYVYTQTFGAFGKQFMADMDRLADAQAGLYMQAATVLQSQYDTLADSAERAHSTAQVSDKPISVASVSDAFSLSAAVGDSIVGNFWESSVGLVGNLLGRGVEISMNIGPPPKML